MAHYARPRWQMRTVKHWLKDNLWQKRTELEENFLMTLWLPQIPHELTENWTQTAAVRRQVIAWAMTQANANEEGFSPHWTYCDVSLSLMPKWNQSLSSDCCCVCHIHQMNYVSVWIYSTPVIFMWCTVASSLYTFSLMYIHPFHDLWSLAGNYFSHVVL